MSTVHSLPGLGARLLTERLGRTLLTVAGIVLGVALFTGSLLATTTAVGGLDRFAEEANGQADVIASPPGGTLNSVVSPGGGEVGHAVVEELRTLPDVEAAVGLLAVPSSFDGPGGATELRINTVTAAALVGADFDTIADVYPFDLAEGRVPTPNADEIVLPRTVAEHIGAEVGDTVAVSAATGDEQVVVVGVLEERGIGRLDRVGLSSLETVRRYASQSGALSLIGIDLSAAVDPNDWIDAHADDVPEGIVLLTTTESLRTFRDQINAFTGALNAIGLAVLFTAAFLIYLTLSMSTVERIRLYGTMSALGATRRQIGRVVLAEAFVIGAVGTLIGVALGIGVAEILRLASSRLLGLFGSPDLVIAPWALAVSATVGITTSLVAAYLPARRAARTDPAAAVRITGADETQRTGSWIVALALVVVGLATLNAGIFPLPGIDIIILGIGAVRLVPYLVRPLARRIGPLLARLSPGGGRVAVQHLVAERTRSAYTLALVMVVMSMAVGITAIFLSFNRSLERQLTVQFGDDLQVTSASTFTPEFIDRLAEVPGVANVTERSRSSGSIVTPSGHVEDIRIETIDPATYFDVASYPFTDGDAEAVIDAFARGPAIIVPTASAMRLGVDRGDRISLRTLTGPVDFEIAATAELQNVPPEFVVSRSTGESLFGASGTDSALVRLTPGFSPEHVRSAIETELADRATFIVTTASELKADTRAQIGAGLNGFILLLLLAGVVGTFGLANTMAVSVFRRYREIGVLRAIGARRRQIRAMAVIESLTLVAVALVLAMPIGVAISRPLLNTTTREIGDLTIHYETPWLAVPILAVIGVAVAIAAAAWPARRASQLDIDEALRFE